MSLPDCRPAATAVASVRTRTAFPRPHTPVASLDEAFWQEAARAATHTGLDGRPSVPDLYGYERLLAELAFTGRLTPGSGGAHDAL